MGDMDNDFGAGAGPGAGSRDPRQDGRTPRQHGDDARGSGDGLGERPAEGHRAGPGGPRPGDTRQFGAQQYGPGQFGGQQFAGPQPGGVSGGAGPEIADGYGTYGHSADPAAGPVGYGPVAGAQAPARRPGRGLAVAGLCAAVLLSGGVGGVIGASLAGGGSTSSLSAPVNSEQPTNPAPDGTVESVAAKVKPSVVSIEVTGRNAGGEGSGVVLSNDGLVITNNHVVDLAKNGGSITVSFSDGATAEASVVGTDPTTDIAVIRAKTTESLTPITLGTSSTLRVGQAVAAVGSPLGLSGTVTTGIVSALDRPVRAGGSQSDQSTVIDAVQTDAAVNPGNSGGALVNMNGELIGINSAIASLGGSSGGESGSIGLGFAIPVDQARRVADQLIKQGYATRAVLGVSVTDPQKGTGAQVRQVEPAGPAAKAGIPQDAVITKVGERVIDTGDALVSAIRSHAPGDVVTVTYAAGGSEPKTVDVTLGEAR